MGEHTQGSPPVNEKHILRDDLQILKDTILYSPKNLVFAYLNLNSLKIKINEFRIPIQDIPLDYFIFSQTKLDKNLLIEQFDIPGYEIRAKRDQNKYGDGLIEYALQGVICKRI